MYNVLLSFVVNASYSLCVSLSIFVAALLS